jgi:hypothetical protein
MKGRLDSRRSCQIGPQPLLRNSSPHIPQQVSPRILREAILPAGHLVKLPGKAGDNDEAFVSLVSTLAADLLGFPEARM